MKTKLLFFGSSENSAIVKQVLEKADYQVSVYKSINDRKRIYIDDLIVVADYGAKIPQSLLDSVKFGGLNLHPSLLPKYRGATPVPWQILNQENTSGISIIKMTDQFDCGPIVAQQTVVIKPDDTALLLLQRCFTAGAELLIKILPDFLSGKIKLTPQPIKSPTPYCHRFTKQDGFISWKEFKLSRQTPELDRKIRGLFPWPGVFTQMPNGKTLKLLPDKTVQLEGKNPISWQQFLAGYKQFLN